MTSKTDKNIDVKAVKERKERLSASAYQRVTLRTDASSVMRELFNMRASARFDN